MEWTFAAAFTVTVAGASRDSRSITKSGTRDPRKCWRRPNRSVIEDLAATGLGASGRAAVLEGAVNNQKERSAHQRRNRGKSPPITAAHDNNGRSAVAGICSGDDCDSLAVVVPGHRGRDYWG